MATVRRIGFWVIVTAFLGCVLILTLGALAEVYLGTQAGKTLAARLIGERIGMPVEVQSIRMGRCSSSISLRIYDPKLSPSAGEILAVDSARADITVFDLALGRIHPKKVELSGVTLNLRLDRDGKLLTTLPKLSETGDESLPAIALSEGALNVHQEGRPEFSLSHVQLSTTSLPDREEALTGQIDDPVWANWTLKGAMSLSKGTGSLTLSTNNGPLALDPLTSIPCIPESIWAHVRPNGRGAAEVSLAQGPDNHFHFSIGIRPAGATLALPDAGTTLSNVTGLIQVTGSKVELTSAKADLAGGTIAIDGSADFSKPATTVLLRVAAKGLDLQALPEDWGLPRDVQGKLQGKANLEIVVHPDGRIEPRGGGGGTIEDAKIRDIPVSIALKLSSNGKKYQFENTGPEPRTPARNGKLSTHLIRALQRAAASSHSSLVSIHFSQPDPPKTEPPQPSMLTATVKLRDVEIGELLDKLDVKLGYRISGKVSAEVDLGIALKKEANQPGYRFTGKLSSPALELEGLVIHDLTATVVYENGTLTLTDLKGAIEQPGQPKARPGNFNGTAKIQRDPPGEVRMSFAFERIPLGEVLKAIPGWSVEVSGIASGNAEFHAAYLKVSDPKGWSATARLNAPELVVAGRATRGLEVGVEIKDGVAKLTNAKVAIEGIPVTAEATLGLTGHLAFSATVQTKATTATDLRKLVPELGSPTVEGVLDTESRIAGTLSPFTFEANGKIQASRLTLGKSIANEISLKWKVTREKLVVSDLNASLFGGTITGSADIPFSRDRGGQFDLGFKNVGAQAATQLVPDFPIQLDGQVSGSINGKLVAAKPGQSRVGQLDVNLSAPKLTVQGIPADRLIGRVSVNGGVFDYKLEGKTLGGSFELKGRYPAVQPQKPAAAPKREPGSFRLMGVDLALVAPELKIPSLAPLRGRLDLDFDFDNDLSRGSGRMTLTGLRWGETVISRDLRGVLLLQDGIFRLSEIAGRVAGGDLQAMAQVRLNDSRRNYFSLELRGADARRLFEPVPELAERIEGPVTILAHGQLGREIRGSGTLVQYGGRILGVPVVDLNMDFDWAMAFSGRGRFAIRQATLNSGTGKLLANISVRWGYETNVSGQIQFIGLPLRSIVPELASSSMFGNGRITGRFVLNGEAVRSLNDLGGTLVATFRQTSVKEIPILQQAVPFLNVSGLTQPFQSGDIRGTLSRGVFRVQRLALVNANAQVFAEGTISLSGQLNAAVVAHTGVIGPASRAFVLFGGKLPVIGPLPLTLVQEVSDFLSNRTIRLSITGSAKNPVVRVNLGSLLSEEAVRFLLARYVLPANASEALGLGLEAGK